MQKTTLLTLLMLLTAALSATAQNAAELTEKGRNAEQMGLTDLAERHYRNAMQADGGDTADEARTRLGILLEQKEYYPEAAALLAQSQRSEGQAHLALCLLQMHRPDSAAFCAARATG